nr:MAG TPA: hypothetical protein [Caudoviricetes sp.]
MQHRVRLRQHLTSNDNALFGEDFAGREYLPRFYYITKG